MGFLHFNNNSRCPAQSCHEYKIFKTSPLIKYFSLKSSEFYTLDKHICIDESLVHFTVKLSIKQYIPSKGARYGVKLYKPCERATGYTYDSHVYTNKTATQRPWMPNLYVYQQKNCVGPYVTSILLGIPSLCRLFFYISLPLVWHLYPVTTKLKRGCQWVCTIITFCP